MAYLFLSRKLDEEAIAEKNDTEQSLQIYNYHVLPLEIIGFGKKKTEISDSLTQKIDFLQARMQEHLPKFINI